MYLSKAEKLLIERRRRCETQADAARRYGTPVAKYERWERSLEHCPFQFLSISPTDYEKCYIYRKRRNFSQAQVAKELGRSRYWVILMEQGIVPCQELNKFWSGIEQYQLS